MKLLLKCRGNAFGMPLKQLQIALEMPNSNTNRWNLSTDDANQTNVACQHSKLLWTEFHFILLQNSHLENKQRNGITLTIVLNVDMLRLSDSHHRYSNFISWRIGIHRYSWLDLAFQGMSKNIFKCMSKPFQCDLNTFQMHFQCVSISFTLHLHCISNALLVLSK